MIITLNNGRKIEVKNINLASGQVDYRRIDDPIYGGDCVMYHSFADENTVDVEVTAALNLSEAEREAAQTAADIAKEEARLAEIKRLEAKAQDILDILPSWDKVSTAVDNISNFAEAKEYLKKLSRVVYWIARETED